jgi:D-3-phosphoglycerate dehydrogenase
VDDRVLSVEGLRMVCCARGGPVNIAVETARTHGVTVTNTPGKNAQAVVELTLAFMIMLARGVSRSQRFLLDGGELGKSAFEGAEFFGTELGGRTVGIVGYGNVGRRLARAATALGMEVVTHDPLLDPASLEHGVRAAPLDTLLETADIVTLHARATAENENLMSAPQFARMRRGSLFINTARESLVDEAALLAALESGHLGGAALDVVRPGEGRNPLLDAPHTVVTPHIGGATHETIERGIAMVADEIDRLASGRPPRFAV